MTRLLLATLMAYDVKKIKHSSSHNPFKHPRHKSAMSTLRWWGTTNKKGKWFDVHYNKLDGIPVSVQVNIIHVNTECGTIIEI